MPGRVEFEYRFRQQRVDRPRSRADEGPMRILVLGGFSGATGAGLSGGGHGPGERSILRVDIDNFDERMRKLAPRAELPSDDPQRDAALLEFSSLDDLHPDALYQRLELFQILRRTRERLLDPATSSELIVELTRQLRPVAQRETPEAAPTPTASIERSSAEDDTATLERLLGSRPAHLQTARDRMVAPSVDLHAFLKRVVAPHVVPRADPRQDQILASIDEATSELMRTILHAPALQRLEATWRSLSWLVSGLETGEDLEIYLLDVSRQDLENDLLAADRELDSSDLYKLMMEKGLFDSDQGRASLLVGDYSFGVADQDLSLLGALGAIASQAGGPFLAAADPALVGCRSLVEMPDPTAWRPTEGEAAERWQALRRSTVASWIGLALPRVLLRLPYGKATDPTERFAFEELTSARDHESYLWGNPAFACALLITRSQIESGFSAPSEAHQDLGDLPAHTYEAEGESRLKPCAEIFMTERASGEILRHGLMPLVSFKDSNRARVARFQSVAEPPAPLSGL